MTNPILPTKPTIASFYQRARAEIDFYNNTVEQEIDVFGEDYLSFQSVVMQNGINDSRLEALIERRMEIARTLRNIEEEMKREYGEANYLNYFLIIPFNIIAVDVPESFTDEESYNNLYETLIEQGKSLVALFKRLYGEGKLFIDERDLRNALLNIEATYNYRAGALASKASKQFKRTAIPKRIDLDGGLGIKASKFPFDPTGLNPLNHISETVSISNQQQDNAKYIIPRHSPFFVDQLKVSRITPEGLIPFVLNEDFMCAGLYADLLEHTVDGKLVATSIIFDDVGVNGEFLIEYQTLGGHYTLDDDGFAKALEKFIDSPMIEDWGEIVGKPLELPAEKTHHDITDFRSFEDVVVAVQELSATIGQLVEQQQRDERDGGFKRLIDSIKQYVLDAEAIFNKVRKAGGVTQEQLDEVKNKIPELTSKLDNDLSQLRTEVTELVRTKTSEVSRQVTESLIPDLEKRIETVKHEMVELSKTSGAEKLEEMKTTIQQDYQQQFDTTNEAIESVKRDLASFKGSRFVYYGRHKTTTAPQHHTDKNIAGSGLFIQDSDVETEAGIQAMFTNGWLTFNGYIPNTSTDNVSGMTINDIRLLKTSTNIPDGNQNTLTQHLDVLYQRIKQAETNLTATASTLQGIQEGTIVPSVLKVGNVETTGTTTISVVKKDEHPIISIPNGIVSDKFYLKQSGGNMTSVEDAINEVRAEYTSLKKQLGVTEGSSSTETTGTAIQNNKVVIIRDNIIKGMSGIQFTDGTQQGGFSFVNRQITTENVIAAPDFIYNGTSLKTKLEQITTQIGNIHGINEDKLQPVDAAGVYSKIRGKIPWVRDDGSIHIGKNIRLTADSSLDFEHSKHLDINLVWDNQVNQYAADFRGVVFCNYLVPRSDKRLKQDIQKINHPQDTINQLNGYRYTFKETNQLSMGVIAQEVEKILPELVHADMESGIKAVNYNGLIALLIETVKAQDARIAKLEEIIQQQL